MKVKEDTKRNKKLFSEIKPGTLFKFGDKYFIKIADYVYRKRKTITNVKVSCCEAFPDFEINEWDETVEAICVENGIPYGFRSTELVEVFPDAFVSVEE